MRVWEIAAETAIKGFPGDVMMRLVTVSSAHADRMPTASFWQSAPGGRARTLVAETRPGVVIDITNRVFSDTDPWRLVAERTCRKNADCIAPEHHIFHLVAPMPDWPLYDISVRSTGRIQADFPEIDGKRQRLFVITEGPHRALVEGFFRNGGPLRGFQLEFEIADPSRFEAIVRENIALAVEYIRENQEHLK